jgi:hypothetical protein
VIYAPVEFIHALANELASRPQPLPWFAPGVIRDPDLARRLARAHCLLEAGDDPLAAEPPLLSDSKNVQAPFSGLPLCFRNQGGKD